MSNFINKIKEKTSRSNGNKDEQQFSIQPHPAVCPDSRHQFSQWKINSGLAEIKQPRWGRRPANRWWSEQQSWDASASCTRPSCPESGYQEQSRAALGECKCIPCNSSVLLIPRYAFIEPGWTQGASSRVEQVDGMEWVGVYCTDTYVIIFHATRALGSMTTMSEHSCLWLHTFNIWIGNLFATKNWLGKSSHS